MAKTNKFEFITTFSKFTSTRLIGEGGSGFVYEVKDENDQIFAAKILKKQGVTTDKRKRFKNEIKFCQHCTHSNIMTIIDRGVFIDNDVAIPFYVMPFYDSSLRNLINDGLKPEAVSKLFPQILDGVEAAHLNNIVHRDLKPENILYRTTEANLVIADFGIARFLEDELYTAVETKAQDRLANFQYAAPEQRVRNRKVDHRADIYAIGLILNEMFTHEIPQGTGYKTISSVSPEYAFLDEIVEKMIRQSPVERLSTINDVKQLLKVRGADFVSEQKLSKLTSTVIPASEIDDPLIIYPIKIEAFDWDNNVLTLVLSQPVNNKWKSALLRMGSYSSLLNKGPEAFTFEGKFVKVRSTFDQVQIIIDYFKSWIPIATNIYRQDLIEELRAKEEEERQKIRMAIEMEEAKARLRKTIKL